MLAWNSNLLWFLEAIKSHNSDKCLLWPFGTNKVNGYGRITIAGKRVYVHRYAFKLAYGRWPLEGRHSCNTPACFNYLHVLDGTHADNMRDASVDGLMHPGEKHGMARLTDKIVLEIRAQYIAYSPTRGANALAKRYGVRPEAIDRIIRRIRWKHI